MLKSEIQQSKKICNQKDIEHSSAKICVLKLNKELNETKASKATYKATIDDMKKKMKVKEKEIYDLKKKREKYESEISELLEFKKSKLAGK